jgi:hypothetical protein
MKWLALVWLLVASASAAAAETSTATPDVAQIAAKNAVARGGLDAWRKIKTMVWIGHIESSHAAVSRLPFVLEMKRPNKTRFEIKAQNRISVRMYDGSRGWKLHPGSDGSPVLQPYTEAELHFAQDGQGIDGPLMDYAAKGISVAMEGSDEIEGHKAYRLNVTFPSGHSRHLWIDAQSFLELKDDRPSSNSFGQQGTVSVYYRDYRTVDGLQLPYLIESGVGSGKATDKMVIDQVLLNPPLDDQLFDKPMLPGRGHMVTVEAGHPGSSRLAHRTVNIAGGSER